MDPLEAQTQYIIFSDKYTFFSGGVFEKKVIEIGLDPDDIYEFDTFSDRLFVPYGPAPEEISIDGETYEVVFPFSNMAESINKIKVAACRYSTCRTEHMLLDEPCGKHYQRLYETLRDNSIFLLSTSDAYKSFISDWTEDYAFNFEEITRSIRQQNSDEEYGFSSPELDKLDMVISSCIDKTREMIERSIVEGTIFIKLLNSANLYCQCRGPGRLKECREKLLELADACSDISKFDKKA